MPRKELKLVRKECGECGKKQKVLPEKDKCCASNCEGELAVINVKTSENDSESKKGPQKRDHRKGRRVGFPVGARA